MRVLRSMMGQYSVRRITAVVPNGSISAARVL
jgi:hypothetical protein